MHGYEDEIIRRTKIIGDGQYFETLKICYTEPD